jgi:hypothetical protein
VGPDAPTGGHGRRRFLVIQIHGQSYANLLRALTDVPGHARLEEIDARYPGAVERLSQHPGIGFTLARDARGALCYY